MDFFCSPHKLLSSSLSTLPPFAYPASSQINKLATAIVFWLLLTVSCSLFTSCDGHGRLIEPPSRASAWRYGFQTPPNYNDHELYCGGFTRQWKSNDGKCGECGDAWDLPEPRPHEYGGKWGQGVVVRKYNPNSEITIRVELTASHMGFFEFRLCPHPQAEQDCLDRNLLKVISGAPAQPAPNDFDTRFYPRNGSRIYEIKSKLPDIKCAQCVLQWRYIAGNNWGICENGSGAVGCGPQEEFRACADIAIGEGGRTIRPFRPTLKPSITTSNPKTDDKDSSVRQPINEDGSKESPFLAMFIVIISLLVVLFTLIAIYLYHYHGQRVKQFLQWKKEQEISNVLSKEKTLEDKHSILNPPPVPPPRTKRLSNVKEMSSNLSSIA